MATKTNICLGVLFGAATFSGVKNEGGSLVACFTRHNKPFCLGLSDVEKNLQDLAADRDKLDPGYFEAERGSMITAKQALTR